MHGRCRSSGFWQRIEEQRPTQGAADGRLATIKVKHFLDEVEPDDGQRLWVEPVGLTRDLRVWCQVHAVLPQFGPPPRLWSWFEAQRDAEAYEYFRGEYHEHLSNGPYRQALQKLAWHAIRMGVTLLHQGDDPEHNTATALYEFLSELQSYCPPQS